MPELHTIVCDGYDREVLAALLRRDQGLIAMRDRLQRLLPHADALVCDLFAALFKLNIVMRPTDALSASVLINRRIVQSVVDSRDLQTLRLRTELREAECAAALPGLLERIMRALGREFRYVPERLMATREVADDEDALQERENELAHLRELPDGVLDDDARHDLADDLESSIATLTQRIDDARREQQRVASRLASEMDESVGLKISTLPGQLDNAEQQLQDLGIGQSGAGRVDAKRRLELGERLLRSRKLQLLAKLVGAFREVAAEARRQRVTRSPQELHSISSGAHLDRLLPSELLGLSRTRPALHREFLRRLAEGQLLEYELHGASSRGPIAVCVDGSGSMRGTKELWAKAVALTLMDIARREKRRCLALVFSSSREIFQVDLLGAKRARGGRARVIDANVLDFAEYFPGGGTDFEAPLERAIDAVATGAYRRGDIVFITDGQAHVSETLLQKLKDKRRKHRFRVRGILVDAADSSRQTLQRFCDDVRLVSDLVADSLRDLFSNI